MEAMTMTRTYKDKSIRRIIFLMMLAFAALVSFDAPAASSCTVKNSGGHVQPDCPDGRKARYDISPKCIENANKAAGSCIDTMPVTNVARIPEDVCYRNEGWSRKTQPQRYGLCGRHGDGGYCGNGRRHQKIYVRNSRNRRAASAKAPAAVTETSFTLNIKAATALYTTRYGHLTNKTGCRFGARRQSQKGQLIGYVGGTGGACGRPSPSL